MNDQMIRMSVFILGLVIFSSLEFFYSYRKRELKRFDRWGANLTIILLSAVIGKILFPSGLIYFSQISQTQNWGILNIFELKGAAHLLCSLLLLDFFIYFQHIMSHKFELLWRIHRVHHTDTDLDATSALRFHPLEIILSILFKVILILIFGISAYGIFIFEILLNFTAMFNHSNIKIPRNFEKALRGFLVTPQMHIIHHSIEKNESDTNYGFNFSFWDRLFGTYQSEFKSEGRIGQKFYRSKKLHGLKALLLLPFKSSPD